MKRGNFLVVWFIDSTSFYLWNESLYSCNVCSLWNCRNRVKSCYQSVKGRGHHLNAR